MMYVLLGLGMASGVLSFLLPKHSAGAWMCAGFAALCGTLAFLVQISQ